MQSENSPEVQNTFEVTNPQEAQPNKIDQNPLKDQIQVVSPVQKDQQVEALGKPLLNYKQILSVAYL